MAIRRRIERAREAAITWTLDRLSDFDPLRQRTSKGFITKLKSAAELATACRVIYNGSPDGNDRFSEAADFLASKVLSHPAVQQRLLAEESRLLGFNLYAPLRACGHEQPAFRAELAQRVEYACAVERLPYRLLDLAYYLDLAALAHDIGPLQEIYRETTLARHPDVYLVTTADTYSITHTVFYLTDFGSRPTDLLSPTDHSYCRRALPRLLDFFLRKGDWDLSFELLLTLDGLGLDDLPVYADGWEFILEAQRTDGAFSNSSDTSWDTDPGDSETTFKHCHHTTLAFLLASQIPVSRTAGASG